MGISLCEYARHRGVSHVAVIKAIQQGRISREPDGTIDPEKADAQWEANTRPRHKRQKRADDDVKAKSECKSNGFKQLDKEAESVEIDIGGMSLTEARTLNETLKAKLAKLKLAELKGELVDKSQAIAHVFKLARTERDAWLNWPSRIVPQLAAELGVDEHKLFVALDAAVRVHLEELGDIQPRLGDE